MEQEEEEEEDRMDHNKMIYLMDGGVEGYAVVTTYLLDSAEIKGKFPIKKEGGELLVRIPGKEGQREFFYRAEWPRNEEEETQARVEEKEEGGEVFGRLFSEPRCGEVKKSRGNTPTHRVVIGMSVGTPPSSSHATETDTRTETETETRTETRTETDTRTETGDREGDATPTVTDATETTTKDERTKTNVDATDETRTDVLTDIDKDEDMDKAGTSRMGTVTVGQGTVLVASETVIMPEVITVIPTWVIQSEEEEEEIPLACRKVLGVKRRVVIEEEEEVEENPLLRTEVCSTTEMDTDCTEYRRRLRKRGMACAEDEVDRKEEEKRKKKIKRKSKSRSPDDIGSLSEDSTERRKKGKGKEIGKVKEVKARETRVKKEAEAEENQEEEEIDLEVDTALAGEEIGSMPSHSLGAVAMEWIDEIEECRKKSKRLQGAVSGTMRRNLIKSRDAIAVLMLRAQAKGDLWFLQAENKEQQAQIAALRREIEDLRKEVGDLRSQIKVEKERKGKERLEELWDPDYPPLPQRPPIRRVANKIPAPRKLSGEWRDEEVTRQVEALETMGKDIGKRKVVQDRNVMEGDTQDTEEEKERRERRGPRIVSDVQLVPPLPLSKQQKKRKQTGNEEWTEVRNRKDKARKVVERGEERRAEGMGQEGEGVEVGPQWRPAPPPPPPRIRMAKPPKHAAVTITARKEGFSYADAMREARAKISLVDLGITDTKVRRAINGGLLIEIEGEEGQAKADKLVAKLKEVLQESATVVSPRKYAEVRISGLDDSVTAEELIHVVARVGECAEEEVRTGPIRMARNGLGSAWARLPMGAAAKACVNGKIRIGWTVARIEVLGARPLQCHRCLHYGHVKYTCKSAIDREGACYNCGEMGHQARSCTAQPTCVVCKDMGRTYYRHRLGGPMCGGRTEQGRGQVMGRGGAPDDSRAPAPVSVGNAEGGTR